MRWVIDSLDFDDRYSKVFFSQNRIIVTVFSQATEDAFELAEMSGTGLDCCGPVSRLSFLVVSLRPTAKEMGDSNRPVRAFTLVELLVVVGIIALLISLLLPGIGKANAAAKRTYCLSNLRNVYHAMALYAEDSGGKVPIGYRSVGGNPSKQYNSMVYSATTHQFVEFGLLYNAGYMDPPNAFFCPSEVNPQSMLNTSTNPWPPGKVNGFCGYGGRPEALLPDDLTTNPNALPKLAQFKGKAILADLTAMPVRVLTRHATGINVAYGDGSAKWVRLDVFEKDLMPCTSLSYIYNDNQDRIWAALDRQ